MPALIRSGTSICAKAFNLASPLTSAMSGARQRPRWHSVRLDRVVRRDSDAREQLLPWLLRLTSGRRDFRGCHLDSAQASSVDGPLHQPRCLGLFDEFADVGETSGLPLRDQRRYADDPEAVLQYAKAG